MQIQDLTDSVVVGEAVGSLHSLCVQPRPFNQAGPNGGWTISGVITGTFPSGGAANQLFSYLHNAMESDVKVNITRLYAVHEQLANISAPDTTREQGFDFIKASLNGVNPASGKPFFSTRRTSMEVYNQPDFGNQFINVRDPTPMAYFPVLILATRSTAPDAFQRMDLINDGFGTGPIQLGYREYLEITTRFSSPLGANTSKLNVHFTMSKVLDY